MERTDTYFNDKKNDQLFVGDIIEIKLNCCNAIVREIIVQDEVVGYMDKDNKFKKLELAVASLKSVKVGNIIDQPELVGK